MTDTTAPTKSPFERADDAIHQAGAMLSTPISEFDRYALAHIVEPFEFTPDDSLTRGREVGYSGPWRTAIRLTYLEGSPQQVILEHRSFAGQVTPLVTFDEMCPVGALTAILNDEGWGTAASIRDMDDMQAAHERADQPIAEGQALVERGMAIKSAIAQGSVSATGL